MGESSRFWDRIAGRYSRSPVADQASYEEKLRLTQELLRPDMEVYEFGCGTGSTSIAHAPYVKHITASDFSQGMIDIAQAKADQQGIGNVTFVRESIDDAQLGNEAFDVIMGHSILHLLADKDAAIAKAYKALKPGGYFVTSTACIGDAAFVLRLMLGILAPLGRPLGLLPRLNAFTATQLSQSMTEAGFEIAHQWQPTKKSAVFIVAKKRPH